MEIDDENLVAYLDGELDEAGATAVAAAAETDPGVRQRLKQLSSSWAMLDELPAERLNSQVAQSTMEMVALAIDKEKRTWMDYVKQYRFAIAASTVVLSLLGGTIYGSIRSHLDENRILGELHFVLNSERLMAIPSTDFLEMLAGIPQLLQRPVSPENDALPRGKIFSMSIEERREWIENLAPDEKRTVANRIAVFNNKPKADIDKARSIGLYLRDTPERRVACFAAIGAYYGLLQQNSSFGEAIAEAIRANDVERQRMLVLEELAYQHNLSSDDQRALLMWADEIFADRAMYYSFNDYEQYVLTNLSQVAADSDFSQEDLEDAKQDLSPQARDLLDAVSTQVQRDVLLSWFTTALQPDDKKVDSELLRENFEGLTAKRQRELLLLPADTVRETLSKPKGIPASAIDGR